MQISFDWDQAKASSNVGKHDVTFEEAMSVFRDSLMLSVQDDSASEERWITIGESSVGRLVLLVHTWTEHDEDRVVVRLISARRPTRNETRQYREGA
ncbi:BrnT family toxin [Lichenibacterium ramalinae]|uniref:BrnT family toxin n=1 Tax=Lichenibacterium ramalinae TaxID=2316527 RepID=A0A4Q2RJA7_9HYPH|nr:BrnT family toxin [Lichenibacterium ramalinae]RYB07632.1 BrnT family toxin [Lichenibacterium ramalinae]